ncbi:MAG: hypothetical protein ACK53L_19800, partial [Pirellulaceae bacterium]
YAHQAGSSRSVAGHPCAIHWGALRPGDETHGGVPPKDLGLRPRKPTATDLDSQGRVRAAARGTAQPGKPSGAG